MMIGGSHKLPSTASHADQRLVLLIVPRVHKGTDAYPANRAPERPYA